MIPLILLALGLGAALTAYELSPRTRSRVDAYIKAIRSANAAHQTADAHLATATHYAQQASIATQAEQQQMPMPAQMPPHVPWTPPPTVLVPVPVPLAPMPVPPGPFPPAPSPPPAPTPAPPAPAQAVADVQTDVAVDHTVAANEANQEAAKNTADAAQTAQTDAEKQAVADSAAKVLERKRQIAEALRTLSVGQCGVRTYPRVTERAKNSLLARLRTEGMGVTGDNPWNIDTRQYNVKLRAVWDPRAQAVKLIVTTGRGGLAGLVTCEEIWKKIDPIMKDVVR